MSDAARLPPHTGLLMLPGRCRAVSRRSGGYKESSLIVPFVIYSDGDCNSKFALELGQITPRSSFAVLFLACSLEAIKAGAAKRTVSDKQSIVSQNNRPFRVKYATRPRSMLMRLLLKRTHITYFTQPLTLPE